MPEERGGEIGYEESCRNIQEPFVTELFELLPETQPLIFK